MTGRQTSEGGQESTVLAEPKTTKLGKRVGFGLLYPTLRRMQDILAVDPASAVVYDTGWYDSDTNIDSPLIALANPTRRRSLIAAKVSLNFSKGRAWQEEVGLDGSQGPVTEAMIRSLPITALLHAGVHIFGVPDALEQPLGQPVWQPELIVLVTHGLLEESQ